MIHLNSLDAFLHLGKLACYTESIKSSSKFTSSKQIWVRDVPIRAAARYGLFPQIGDRQFWTWTQARFFCCFFFYIGAQFVAEHRRARNVTPTNLWIECLQCGNNLEWKAKAVQPQRVTSAIRPFCKEVTKELHLIYSFSTIKYYTEGN